MNRDKYNEPYEVGEAPDQTEEKIRRYGSCEVAKELEGKFKDALYKLVYVDQELAYLDMSSMDNVYDMLQRGNEYISYLMAAGAYKPKRRVHDGYSPDPTIILSKATEKSNASIMAWHREDGVTEILNQPTTLLSKAIEQVEQMGDYKVMVALVDPDNSKPKEERLYTFTDIESKKLREVIYKEMERNFE